MFVNFLYIPMFIQSKIYILQFFNVMRPKNMPVQMKDAVSMLKHQNKPIKDTVKTL